MQLTQTDNCFVDPWPLVPVTPPAPQHYHYHYLPYQPQPNLGPLIDEIASLKKEVARLREELEKHG